MIEWALVPACAVADRLRGGLYARCRHCDLAGEIGYGLLLAAILGLPWYVWPGVALGWLIGGRPGWGYPMGQAVLGKVQHAWAHPDAKPERWQLGPLKSQPWFSLIVRGLLWGGPCLPLAYWFPIAVALPLGMAIAMPAGAFFDRATGMRYKAGEWVRGGLMGALCAIA